MKRTIISLIMLVFIFSIACKNKLQQTVDDLIKAYNIDFNWGEGGPNGFAAPGLWADADPKAHVNWYYKMGLMLYNRLLYHVSVMPGIKM